MNIEVSAFPKLGSLLLAWMAIVIPIGIIIFILIKVFSSIKDIKRTREDMERVIELLEEKED